MTIHTLAVLLEQEMAASKTSDQSFSASRRIVPEGRIAGSALPQTTMQLALVAETTDWGVSRDVGVASIIKLAKMFCRS